MAIRPPQRRNFLEIRFRFKILLIFVILISVTQAQLRMKRVCFLQTGQNTQSNGNTICYDSDHNGLNELMFRTGNMSQPSNPIRLEIWEYHPMNRYELVFADTGVYPYPPGITTGNFRPYDVGDIDRDSLTDLVGPNIDKVLNQDIEYNVVTTQESPNYSYYPESLSWSYRYANNLATGAPFYFPPDLDNDGRNEIMFVTEPPLGVVIFENRGNNQNEVAWNTIQGIYAWSFAFGDFDLDGHKEFVTADGSTLGRVYVYENTGPDQYQQVYVDTVHLPNGSDVFSGDVDGDGRPEFFVGFHVIPTSTWYLYMWEATGNNTYQRTLVAQRTDGGGYYSSKCGDIDGDGIDEIIWAIGTKVVAYKATGNNQFQPVWAWDNDHGGSCTIVNVYDMNKNGYNEIIVGGAGKTSIFEVEAVRLLRPNGGETFHVDSSEAIQWQKFYPPRCDSLSLFYSIDNGNNYTMITHGLSGNDTSYLWTVPNVNSDSCKIKIIAYGPGWQYDESDGIFSITSTGMSEIATHSLAMTLSLKVFPSPVKSMSVIQYSLPVKGKVSIQLFDISGKLIKTLVNQEKNAGNYSLIWNGTDENNQKVSAGVYFCILKTDKGFLKQKMLMV